jgi:hypothetical protein
MKALARLLLVLLVLAVPAFLAWRGFEAREHQDEKSHAEEHEAEAGVVKLDAEAREHAGIEFATLAAATLKPEVTAFGRVLDPAPLATLDDELAAAEAALEGSSAAKVRAQSLFQGGENVARKTVETAESQLRADEIKLTALRRRLALEWGASFAAVDSKARHDFVEQLIAGRAALVRVDLPAGDYLADIPKAARFAVLGLESQPLAVREIIPTSSADPKTQAQSFLLRIEAPAFPLRPGMAVTAWLEIGGEAQVGVSFPRAAVVRFDGRTWFYAPADENEFKRRSVSLGALLADGYFVAGLKPGEKIVVHGAQSLLSHEAKAVGGAEEE